MSTQTLTRPGEIMPGLFDDFFRPWNEWFDNGNRLGRILTMPAVNISETRDDFKVSLAAPGMKKDDFNIDVNGSMITISCSKEEKKEEKESDFTRREYNYSSFKRSFTLPDEVNKEKIDARYEDGILRLSLPKIEKAKKLETGRHIVVK